MVSVIADDIFNLIPKLKSHSSLCDVVIPLPALIYKEEIYQSSLVRCDCDDVNAATCCRVNWRLDDHGALSFTRHGLDWRREYYS
jgi:hypothetical protein